MIARPSVAGSPEMVSGYRKEPGQAGSVRARSKTRGRCCVLRAGALDCAQLEDASTTAEPGITGETVKGSCARMADRALENLLSQLTGRHEKPVRTQCLTSAALRQCPLSEFSSIALADRKIRFRRELPATRPPSTAAPPDPGKTADSKELDSKQLTSRPCQIAALIRGCLRDRHAPHFTPSWPLRPLD